MVQERGIEGVMTTQLREFVVTTSQGARVWYAEDNGHAAEQHMDAFPDEVIQSITLKLWDRKRVDALKRSAWLMTETVMLSKLASPADSLQAATEMGYPHFSHLSNGYPVYSTYERKD